MRKIIVRFGKKVYKILTKISPMLSASILFVMRTHKIPNLTNPKTFNEKTTYLKLYNYSNNDLVLKCADKFEVREYIKQRGFENILTKIYGVYDKAEDIDWDKLPNKFALKCTHGCAYNIICKDKSLLNIEETVKKLNAWLNEKYGFATTELHYTKIKPRIIAEEYLCDKNNKMPIDYKIYCMNGEAKVILVCSERDEKLKLNYFDLNWNKLNYSKKSWTGNKIIKKPSNIEEMISIANTLSKEFDFVRVDLYNKNGETIFGELTFTPACCCAPYYTKSGDVMLGELLKINMK